MANGPIPPKSSKIGFVLAILSLILSAIGSGLVHAHYKPTGGTTGSKVGNAVASGTGHVVSSLIGVPFLVVGITLALVAALLVLVKLTKGLKAGGLLFSIISILISIWSFSLVVAAFKLLKAH